VRQSPGGEILAVREGSLAHRIDLHPGDRLLAINGHNLRDVIDYQFYSADESLALTVRRADGRAEHVQVDRWVDDDMGLEFTDPTFDGIRRCNNHCEFCFIHQMPPGMRKTLYVRDDDLRYSFLYGNFVTLTNLTEEDWERLAEQRLSPLYVSVHATDRTLRARMLGLPDAPDVLQQISRLGRLGVEVHAQIVVVPGVNDGQVLQRSVDELAKLFPTVTSVGIVPVGLTRYQSASVRTMTGVEARALLAWATPRRRELQRRLGLRLVYPSDEVYLLAGMPIPGSSTYDGFPQLANGIGLTRLLLDDWSRARRRSLERLTAYGHITLVCGRLIAPTLARLAAELAQAAGIRVSLVPVENEFFGSTVTVSGLLTGGDVKRALSGVDPGRLLVLPRVMFDASAEVTLDDCSLKDIQAAVGVPVLLADRLSDLIAGQSMEADTGRQG
jgi:putative radical SAM enzyme (TIGR03279 family)